MKIKKNVAISESGFVFDAGTGDSYSMNAIGKEIILMLKDNINEVDIKKKYFEKI